MEVIGTYDTNPVINAVVQFYRFWQTADSSHLEGAVSDKFVDHNHAGRAPGKQGLHDAATAFHKTCPDFDLTVDRLIVSEFDHGFVWVTAQGHVTGTSNFKFTDVLKLKDDVITDNWPLEGANPVT